MQKQKHRKWECTYHIVIVPKYRKKVLYKAVRSRLGEILKELCRQKGVEIVKGNAKLDHVHMLISIPPKLSVSQVVGFMKGKSAIKIHNEKQKKRKMTGKHFWSRGYFVRTVGLDEKMIINYVKNQARKDKREDGNQLDMGW